MEDAARAAEYRRRSLGDRIRAARKDKAWKQRQLAAAVSVDTITVSRWERGQHAPDLDTLEVVARALEKPIGYFIDDSELPKEPPPDGLRDLVAELSRRVDELERRADAPDG